MNEAVEFPDLSIKFEIDANGDGLIFLEQYADGETESTVMHTLHLRYMAEKLGLVNAISAEDAKAKITFKRRMRTLRRKMNDLSACLEGEPHTGEVDVRRAVMLAESTGDLVHEYCEEMDDGNSNIHRDTDDLAPF